MLVRTSVLVDRPIEQVWAYLADDARELEWRAPALKRLKRVGEGPIRPGSRYEGVVAIGPLEYPYVNELTRFEPPNRISWKAISSTGWVIGSSGSYILERDGNQTRLTHEIDLEPNRFAGRLVAPLLGSMGSQTVMPMLKKLKAEVEKQ